MTAWRLFHDLRRRGIRLRVRDGRIQAAGALTPAERQAIVALKDGLLDLIEGIEERAAIHEFDAGMPRSLAEDRALSDCMGRHPR
jgi:hypothetical protein